MARIREARVWPAWRHRSLERRGVRGELLAQRCSARRASTSRAQPMLVAGVAIRVLEVQHVDAAGLAVAVVRVGVHGAFGAGSRGRRHRAPGRRQPRSGLTAAVTAACSAPQSARARADVSTARCCAGRRWADTNAAAGGANRRPAAVLQGRRRDHRAARQLIDRHAEVRGGPPSRWSATAAKHATTVARHAGPSRRCAPDGPTRGRDPLAPRSLEHIRSSRSGMGTDAS